MSGRDDVERPGSDLVTLRVPAALLPNFLADVERSRHLTFHHMSDPVELTIEVTDADRLLGVLLRYAGHVEIVAPFDLRQLVEMSCNGLRSRHGARSSRPVTDGD